MRFTFEVTERAGDIVPALSFWDDNFTVAVPDVDDEAGGGGDAGEARAERAPYFEGFGFGDCEMFGPVDGVIVEEIVGADTFFSEGSEKCVESVGVVVDAFEENGLSKNGGVGFFAEGFEGF